MRNREPHPSLFDERPPPERQRPKRLGHADVEYAPVRDILTRATGFMDAYDFTLNPYSGCSFGCPYCYAAFFSYSTEKRDSWGLWINVKDNAVERLRRRRGSLDGKLIYMSSVTDPYQPIERRLKLTRKLLEILAHHRPKLVVQTRSPDVVRDTDLYRATCRTPGDCGSMNSMAVLLIWSPIAPGFVASGLVLQDRGQAERAGTAGFDVFSTSVEGHGSMP